MHQRNIPFPSTTENTGPQFLMLTFASKTNITQQRVREIGCVCITIQATLHKKLNRGHKKMTPTQTSCNIIHGKSLEKYIKSPLHLHCYDSPKTMGGMTHDPKKEKLVSPEKPSGELCARSFQPNLVKF